MNDFNCSDVTYELVPAQKWKFYQFFSITFANAWWTLTWTRMEVRGKVNLIFIQFQWFLRFPHRSYQLVFQYYCEAHSGYRAWQKPSNIEWVLCAVELFFFLLLLTMGCPILDPINMFRQKIPQDRRVVSVNLEWGRREPNTSMWRFTRYSERRNHLLIEWKNTKISQSHSTAEFKVKETERETNDCRCEWTTEEWGDKQSFAVDVCGQLLLTYKKDKFMGQVRRNWDKTREVNGWKFQLGTACGGWTRMC